MTTSLMRNYFDYKALIEQCGVHTSLGAVGSGWGIEQNPHELATFLEAVHLPVGSTVLEIGTGYRAGLARFMTEHLGWQVITIDRYPPDTPAPLARQVVGLSENVVDIVRGEYDVVIIDADHRYEAVKRDFELYGMMGQIVMFHDIEGLRECEGAARFWHELRTRTIEGFSSARYVAVAHGLYRAGIGWIKRIEA